MEYTQCRFSSSKEKAQKIGSFLKKYGDGLPSSAIKKATTTLLPNFQSMCDKKGDIVSVGTWEKNDWYLCTGRYLATHPQHRNKGLGTVVLNNVFRDALTAKDENGYDKCLVLAADITSTNISSLRVAEKNGFQRVSSFYWTPKDKAEILHFIKYRSPQDFKVPRQITSPQKTLVTSKLR